MCSTTDRIGSVFRSAVAYEFIAGKICHNNRTGTSAFLCMRGIHAASF